MASGAKVSFPARCVVMIGYGTELVSQVFPAGLPIDEFFESMVELLDTDLKRRGFDGVALPPGSYELQLINGVRVDLSKSFDELGVEDGETLVLVPASEGEPIEPQIESLSSALADVSRRLGKVDEWNKWRAGQPEPGGDPMFRPVTARSAWRTALVLMALAVTVVAALTLRARTFTDSWVPAAVAGGLAVLLVIGAVVVLGGWPDRRDLFGGFGWMATVLVAVAVAVGPPGALNASHLFIGSVALTLGAVAVGVLARTRVQTAVSTAVITVASLVALLAAVRMFSAAAPVQVLGVVLIVAVLIVERFAPTIALWVAKVRPPHFGSVTGRDLFQRREGMPVETISPVTDDDEEDDDATDEERQQQLLDRQLLDTSARGALIAASARMVNAVQLGVCVGVALLLPAAVWMTLGPGQPRAWGAVLLSGLVAGVFITQGRAFVAQYQAISLVCGAAAAVCAGVLKYALEAPGDASEGLLWPVVSVAVFAGCGLGAALLVPATKFRPLIRLLVEWMEVFAMVAIMPLAAWLGGLYSWLRP